MGPATAAAVIVTTTVTFTVPRPAPGLIPPVFLVLLDLLRGLFGTADKSPDTKGGQFASQLVPLHLACSRQAGPWRKKGAKQIGSEARSMS